MKISPLFTDSMILQRDAILPIWGTASPGAVVTAGKATIATRIISQANDGGMRGPRCAMKLRLKSGEEGASIDLTGSWTFVVEHQFESNAEPVGPGNQNSPAILYNNMFHPMVPFALKGFTWYQGESNCGKAEIYKNQLQALITSWRNVWGQGALPFIVVQLANIQAPPIEPEEVSSWAEMRSSQFRATDLPKVGVAITHDIGEADDIHPTNKQDVGKRLAYWALGEVYGQKDQLISGPVLSSHVLKDGVFRLRFDHRGDGFVEDHIIGFAVAEESGYFEWATATVEGDEVVVHAPSVPNATRLQYAWAANPQANLASHKNGISLPATCFKI